MQAQGKFLPYRFSAWNDTSVIQLDRVTCISILRFLVALKKAVWFCRVRQKSRA